MLKQSQIFTVRSKNGDLVGTWRGFTAKDAIAQAIRQFAQSAATFRQPITRGMTHDCLTASVEG